MTTKLSCGDCSWYDKCESEKLKAVSNASGIPTLTKNEAGRCDFYTGPDKEVKQVPITW